MKVGSLFAGIGGFDLGFERAGLESAWQVERDRTCLSVLKRHFPNAARHGDITHEGRDTLGAVDLVCGGFPCQDVSHAGRRKGLAGKRSGLWWEFHRVLAELRPRWCVIENVPGLLSSREGRDFAAVLSGLAELGYLAAWRVLDAEYFAVAQKRYRVFVVGCLGSGAAAEVLFESEGVFGDPAPRRSPGQSSAAAARGDSAGGCANTLRDGHRGARHGDPGGNLIVGSRASHITTKTGNRFGDVEGNLIGREVARTLSDGHGGPRYGDGINLVSATVSAKWAKGSGGPAGDECQNLVVNMGQLTHPANRANPNPKPNGQAPALCAGDKVMLLNGPHGALRSNPRNNSSAITEARSLVVRMREGEDGGGKGPLISEESSLTLGTANDQTLFAEAEVRRLTPVECERLQGFPDGWTEGHSDTQRYKMLGNAVAVPVAEWIARRILKVEGRHGEATEEARLR